MSRIMRTIIAGATGVVLSFGGVVACGDTPKQSGAQKCAAVSGTAVKTETDGDVLCQFKTQRRYCKDSGETIVAGGRTGWKKATITCQKEFDSDFDTNDS